MARVPFSLTSLTAMKTFIGIDKASRDSEINALIPSVSHQIARYINRHESIESMSRTEVHDVESGQQVWQLAAYPVTSITSVKYDIQREFASSTALDTADFNVQAETGLLRIDFPLTFNRLSGIATGSEQGFERRFGRGTGWLQVVYTGGIASSLQALRSFAPDLELACQVQIQSVLKRQKVGPDKVSVVGQGGSTAWTALALTEYTRQILERYRTWNAGS